MGFTWPGHAIRAISDAVTTRAVWRNLRDLKKRFHDGKPMNPRWLTLWLRTCEPPQGPDTIDNEYAVVCTHYSSLVLTLMAKAESEGLQRIETTQDMPAYMKTAWHLSMMKLKSGWYAPAVGYYISDSGVGFEWLYDTRITHLRKDPAISEATATTGR